MFTEVPAEEVDEALGALTILDAADDDILLERGQRNDSVLVVLDGTLAGVPRPARGGRLHRDRRRPVRRGDVGRRRQARVRFRGRTEGHPAAGDRHGDLPRPAFWPSPGWHATSCTPRTRGCAAATSRPSTTCASSWRWSRPAGRWSSRTTSRPACCRRSRCSATSRASTASGGCSPPARWEGTSTTLSSSARGIFCSSSPTSAARGCRRPCSWCGPSPRCARSRVSRSPRTPTSRSWWPA